MQEKPRARKHTNALTCEGTFKEKGQNEHMQLYKKNIALMRACRRARELIFLF
jgi:hypothetical protein